MTTLTPFPLSRPIPFANPQLKAIITTNAAKATLPPIKPLQKLTAPNTPNNPIYPGKFLYPANWGAMVAAGVDLRFIAPPIEDQGSVGDCTANATCGALEFFQNRAGMYSPLSELFNYWYSRFVFFGTAPTADTGSTTEAALSALSQYGICLENTWPTTESDLVQPSNVAIAEALNYTVDSYSQLISLASWYDYEKMIYGIMFALSKGFPVIFSFNVGQTIYNLTASQVYEPINSAANPVIGGHDVVICGYTGSFDAGTLKFIVRNSWGTSWCDGGYFYMDPTVIVSDGDELWVVQSFMNYTQVGNDVTSLPIIPTPTTTLLDLMNYVFRIKFGRETKPAGQFYWINNLIAYMSASISNGAQGADLTYMKTHNNKISLSQITLSNTLTDLISYIFQTYFGRAPASAGINYFTTAVLQWLVTSIVNSAASPDKQYMIDNDINQNSVTP
jgi:hypothetical protein